MSRRLRYHLQTLLCFTVRMLHVYTDGAVVPTFQIIAGETERVQRVPTGAQVARTGRTVAFTLLLDKFLYCLEREKMGFYLLLKLCLEKRASVQSAVV